MIARRLRTRCRDERGAEVIEVALTLPLLLLVVLGIIEFGFMFQQYEVVTNAAREGARLAVLPTYASADAITRVDQYLDAAGLVSGSATTTVGAPVALPVGGSCAWTVTVNVSYPHPVPFLGGIAGYFGGSWGTVTLHAASNMRTEAAAGACP
jgi:Flp pilus assembly protein TadG